MTRKRIIAAFLLSPIGGALYLLTLGVIVDNLNPADIIGVSVMAIFYTLIGYVAEIVLGIPLLLIFRRAGFMKFRWFILGGLVIGIAVWIVVEIWFFGGFGDLPASHHFYFALMYCVPPAVISTIGFWFLGRVGQS